MYQIGMSKVELTKFIENIGMMGWGDPLQRVKGVLSPIYVRTAIIDDAQNQTKIAFVCAEICFISLAIRQYVIKELMEKYHYLGIGEENLMLSATHTHSTPSGYSHYILYNISGGGFCPELVTHYGQCIIESILQANSRKQNAKINFHSGDFKDTENVVFNRAWQAWNLNPDVEKCDEATKHLATDRQMSVMQFETDNGMPLGCITWFAVHGTSLHHKHELISSDNKGHAAKLLETHFAKQNANYIAIFAQGASGDASPNFIKHRGDSFYRGNSRNDVENMEENGKLQYYKASEIINSIDKKNYTVKGQGIDYILSYSELHKTSIKPEFSNGLEGQSTSVPILGTSFINASTDGGGVSTLYNKAVNFFLQRRNPKKKQIIAKTHGDKKPLWDMQNHRLMGLAYQQINLPKFIVPMLNELKRQTSFLQFKETLVPCILPLQIFIIGNIALVAIPAEVTTQAGRLLKETVLNTLKNRQVHRVILTGYANAYAGYVTTKAEYDLQLYEGSSTYFGKWTLAAYQTIIQNLSMEMLKPKYMRIYNKQLKPPIFLDEHLSHRLFQKS
jgi:neutral ceramidase